MNDWGIAVSNGDINDGIANDLVKFSHAILKLFYHSDKCHIARKEERALNIQPCQSAPIFIDEWQRQLLEFAENMLYDQMINQFMSESIFES